MPPCTKCNDSGIWLNKLSQRLICDCRFGDMVRNHGYSDLSMTIVQFKTWANSLPTGPTASVEQVLLSLKGATPDKIIEALNNVGYEIVWNYETYQNTRKGR